MVPLSEWQKVPALAGAEKGKEKTCYVAHVGDSKAMIIRKERNQFVGRELTEDHKPSLPLEKKR